jgi:hypothetical protein
MNLLSGPRDNGRRGSFFHVEDHHLADDLSNVRPTFFRSLGRDDFAIGVIA